MDKPVSVEAIFLAAADPAAMSRFYTQALGLSDPEITPDGQYTFSGNGVFFAIEPVDEAPGAVDGQLTIWYRVDDVAGVLDRMTAAGAQVVLPPSGSGDEVVAVVLAPSWHRIGLIGS